VSASNTLEIPRDHPAFAGHFPGFPVLPGALLIDETLHIIRSERSLDPGEWQIASAKFQGVVRPGDTLLVEHESPHDGLIRFVIRVENRTVATGSLTAGTGRRGAA
jgi:3-hydroxymyristoyl/3-hydroxydecanoyl-(acyl carrier protein) dehydratase